MLATMNRQVLVLNKSWQAIHVSSLSHAISKVWLGHAKIVDPEDYQMYEWEDWASLKPNDNDYVIRGGRIQIKAPEVIVLTSFDRLVNAGVTFNRRNVYIRDKQTCQYCSKKLASEDITIDHVIPRSRPEGKTAWDNCVVACVSCNSKKADRTPEQAGMILLSIPKKPKWVPAYKKGSVLSSWEKFISAMYWNVPLQD